MRIKDYARFDFRMKNGVPYLFDIAGTPYTIHHSSIAYLFTQYYHLPYESIYKVVVACMLSNYDWTLRCMMYIANQIALALYDKIVQDFFLFDCISQDCDKNHMG